MAHTLLDETQKAALKTYILSQPDLAPLTSGPGTDYFAIMNALNANASPTQLAWRSHMTPVEIDEAADYATFDSIAAGKRDSWGFLLAYERDFTRNKVRKWVTDVWGSATAGSVAESILQAATKKASRAEVVLGGTFPTAGTVTAMKRNWEGEVQLVNISDMFNV